MFDGLLKSKFYSKCKSAIKMTKTRMEIIKRKRSAMQKYLKNDVIDLLKNGLDVNAYGRIEGLWNELNLSSCYDHVEQFCTLILNNLASMDKQRECPEECKEAASSLMFAAARFSDLPELRELRTVFSERYGNSIQFYANKDFVHKLKSTPPTKDMKLKLLQGIALEVGREWNSKTLERKLYKNPPTSAPDATKNGHEDKGNSPKGMDDSDQKGDTKGAMKYAPSQREAKRDAGDGKNLSHLSYGEAENNAPIKDIQVDCINRKVQGDELHTASTSEEENDDKKPFYYKSIRPPYMKSEVSITNTATNVPPTGYEIKVRESIQKSGLAGESDDLPNEDPTSYTKAKPKSVRRRSLKTLPGKDREENSGGASSETMKSKGINQGGGNEGRQHLKIPSERQHDERDEEERQMDRILMHLSRKKLPHDTVESKPVSKLSEQAANGTGRGTKDRSRNGPPTRVASLPADSSPTEAKNVHTRASSFQPEVLNSNGHVHPKLPDYDDFMARLAALRGNLK
ncbi:hypothetical protein ACH5RR_024517 [Cinchona calisaya]|uniref:Regulator of Vps4 activity in the MVB pathway protein n=1 Tax=Cinchona calisaya TaxID=153742 RepID=A0ABD2Z0B8_9GENT